METLVGAIDRVVFRSPTDSFAVARFRLEGVGGQRTYEDVTTIVGELGRVVAGEHLRLGGDWERHPKHGRHFRVAWCEQRLPATIAGMEKFLGSGIIKGIGPATARMIVECFGEGTMEVLESHPEQLKNVPKLGPRKASLIARGWHSHRQMRELLLFLQSHDLPAHLANRIREKYGEQCLSIIQRDPYQLAYEVQGIGFRTADDMAVKLGLPPASISRFVAGMRHVLEEATREGHVYLPQVELLERAAKLLEVRSELLEPALLEASRRDIIVLDGEAVYLVPFFLAERNAAKILARIQSSQSFLSETNPDFDADAAVQSAVKSLGISLADGQLEAGRIALSQKVAIVTGGPGTGKTTCLQVIITALDVAGIPYSLCAPTGRAAKRMAAATGRPASTIHRLLGYQPATNDFAFTSDRKLPQQFVIVDEASMLDILLFNSILKAIPEESHLLLVGDSDQLPAVGPGNVLGDLLASDTIPKVTLDELFRQAQNSQITVAAHQIRRGQVPAPSERAGDLYLIRVEGGAKAQAVVKDMVVTRIPARFGLNPKTQIQVLSPTHRGPAGVTALNGELQSLLNPATPSTVELAAAGRSFRQGDKVMQVRNNYDKDVYNGDVGLVSAVDLTAGTLTVKFDTAEDSRYVDYDAADLTDLTLAYAASVHKSQGSEFPCVVLVLLRSHYPLLQRNLLYTAITRAAQLCVLVYEPQALPLAINSHRGSSRFTKLGDRLTTMSQVEHELGDEPLERETAIH